MFKFKFLILLFVPVVAWADNSPADSAKAIDKIENHLNKIETFKASFQQHTPGEVYSSGMFYYKKPRKFLWQYHIPHEQKVVSNGSRIFFHDPQTEQTTQLPPSSGFANFLSQKPMTLKSDDFSIESIQIFDGIIDLELKADDEESARFHLKFSHNPVKLLSMTQRSEFGSGIGVVFSNHRINQGLEDDLFNFKPALEAIPE